MDAFATIETLALALREGRITSLEIVDAALHRIAALDPKLHAFALVFAEEARAQARAADRNRADAPDAGPLSGIPIALKDLVDVAGRVTAAGSRALPAHPATASAGVVARLEAAGMIVLGKTHTVEFAFGGWGTNPVVGTPWNPWDLAVHRAPGGSSSGSAVAVASGLVPAALGTDTGGSVRTPSCFCGLVGLKTSRGLIGRSGVFPLALSLDTVGPLVRSVRDAALLLAAMAGPDSADAATLGAPVIDPLSGIEDGVAGMRIGVLPDAEMAQVAPDIRALFDAALGTLAALGARIATIALPRPLAEYLDAPSAIMGAESYARLGALVDAADNPVSAEARRRIGRGRDLSAATYLRLLERRAVDQTDFAEALEGFDAIASPVCFDVAPPVDALDEDAIPTLCGRFVNYLDLASLALPIGLARGLPAGMQVMVRRFDDALALRIGRAFETARGGLFTAPPGLASCMD
jgi:aspartyl-tRNA(Asn)/glutamyl-tRNA(Gln) amidotransferase subunit A